MAAIDWSTNHGSRSLIDQSREIRARGERLTRVCAMIVVDIKLRDRTLVVRYTMTCSTYFVVSEEDRSLQEDDHFMTPTLILAHILKANLAHFEMRFTIFEITN